MVIIRKSPSCIKYLTESDLKALTNLGNFDHINQMITLSVITLSGFQCTNLENELIKR